MNKNRAEPYEAYGEEMKTRVKVKNVLIGLPILAAITGLTVLNMLAYGCLKRAGLRK
jgi:hypothetical protein